MDTRSATQDPTLYLLHSALVLAVGSDRDYHGSQTSTPLPKLGAAQGRKFLQGVLNQTTDGEEASQSRNKRRRLAGVRAHPPTRRSLWPDANGEKGSPSIAATPTPIRTALEHLPSYWKQHNALCEGCGGIVLPGVTATYAGRRKKQRRLDGKDGRRVDASCLVCRQEADEQGEKQGRRDDCPPTSWLAEDVEAMKRSKGRFASVRSRKRTKRQVATPLPPPTSSRAVKPAKIDSTATKSEPASKAPLSAASASAALKEKASRTAVEAKPSSSAGPSRPAPGPTTAAVPPSPPRPTKKSTLPPAASVGAPTTNAKAKSQPHPQPQPSPATAPPSERKARPPPPAVDSTNSNARRDKPASTEVDQEKQRKHDHKAALRAMLSGAGAGGGGGGSRKKKDKGDKGGVAGSGSGSGATGGGGGGLADFLAGL